FRTSSRGGHEQVQAQVARKKGCRELALHTVAGRIEPWCERTEPAFARGHHHNPAADPALPRQPDGVEPLAGRLVESSGRHHHHRATAAHLVDDLLPRGWIPP